LAIKVHNKNQERRVDRWSNTYPRAIPNYSVVSEGQYYFYGGGANMRAFGGDYYRAQDECDSQGDNCWGFQTTFGCADRLGCSQALILEDPMETKMHSIVGTRVYTKITQTWDAVPLQCTGLQQNTDASTVGECEFSCTSDSECQIYQWLEDNTCWIGQSNDCTSTDGHVMEGYRIRPVAWTPVQKQCDGLKLDITAKGNLEQCQYNCQWDQTCDSYQFFKDGQCWRGKSACDGVFNPKVDSDGKKDYKFIWKPLMGECSGLDVDTSASGNPDACKSNCEADENCSLWQYYENGECYRGNAADCYTLHSRTVSKGGYRWYVTNQDKDEKRKIACDSWEQTADAAISGYNRRHLDDVSVEDCKQSCCENEWCKSFDYYKNERQCDLADVNAADVGLKTDYSGNPYDHYELKEEVSVRRLLQRELNLE